MFNQLKDIYNLRKQAAELQKQMEGTQVVGQSRNGSFKVTINGQHELLKLDIEPNTELNPSEIEKNVKEALNDAQEKLKSILAEKFKGML